MDHQFPAFAGGEGSLFSLLFWLREDPARTTVAATEAIADSVGEQVEPLFGLCSLLDSLSKYVEQANGDSSDGQKKAFGLGLRLMGRCFERLPKETLEEELPKARELISQALNDQQAGDLRRSAVTCLVSAQSVMRDETKLYAIMDGLTKDQVKLCGFVCKVALVADRKLSLSCSLTC